MVCAAPLYVTVFPEADASRVGIMVVPVYVKEALAPCVNTLGTVLASVEDTVIFPLFVVLALISNRASVPVPEITCPPVDAVLIVTVVLVNTLFSVRPPAVVSIPAPVPVISPVDVMLTPPEPISVVNAPIQFAFPPV